MTFGASTAYWEQVGHVSEEATTMAETVAAHIENTGPAGDATLLRFLEDLPLPTGGSVSIDDSKSVTLYSYSAGPQSLQLVPNPVRVPVPTRGWSVSVSFPTTVAFARAKSYYQNTI